MPLLKNPKSGAIMVQPKHKFVSEELRIKIYRLHQRGTAAKVISMDLDVPLTTVYNIIRKGV